MFWVSDYVLHLEARKHHHSHRGAGFAEVAAAAINSDTIWLELEAHHAANQLRYTGLFIYREKLHQILATFVMSPHKRCVIKTSHIADQEVVRAAKNAKLL